MNNQSKKGLIIFSVVLVVTTLLFFGTAYSSNSMVSSYTGRVEVTEVDLNFKVPGKIAKLQVKEGDEVKQGQVIAMLECEELKAKEKQAQAVVQAAYQQVAQAEEAYHLTEKQSNAIVNRANALVDAASAQAAKAKKGARAQEIKAAEAVVQKAYAGYKLADKTYSRVLALLYEGALPQQEIDKAEAALNVAKDDWEAAKQQLALVKEGARAEDIQATEAKVAEAKAALSEAQAGQQQTYIRLAALQAAKAQLKQAQGALEEVKAYLTSSVIKAPISGVITLLNAEAGEMVSSGMPLATISNLKEAWVEVKVPETDISKLKLHGSAIIRCAGMENKAIQGEIVRISALPDFATKRATNESGENDIVSFGVKVSIANNDFVIKPGMSAKVSFK